jgi:hypothetical protein
MKINLLVVAGAFLVSSATYAADTSTLVRQSIRDGEAHGYIDGPIFEQSRKQLNATGLLTLRIKKVYDFKEADCARLHLYFTQAQALFANETMPRDYQWESLMSVCLDGSAPQTTAKRSN